VFSEFTHIQWQSWIALLVGVAFTSLTALVGLFFLRRRHSAAPPKNLTPQDPFLEGSPSERRYSARRPGKQIRVYISNENAESPPEEGWIVDRSLGGLCLLFDREVKECALLTVRAADVPVDSPWVQVQVKRCWPGGDNRWELGCEFVRNPSWSTLLQFG